MPGGGVLHHMVTVLKNNSRRKIRVRFDRRSMKEKVYYKEGKIEKTATPYQLQEIRNKIRKEQRRERNICYIVILSIVAILYILFNFAKF